MDSLSSTVFSRANRAFWTRPAAVMPALFLLGTVAAGTCQAQKYTVTKLEALPGGTYTSAARMNKAGEVVGSADDSNGFTKAVAWNNAVPTIVWDVFNPPRSSPPGSYSDAVAINNQGVIVGNGYVDFAQSDFVFEIGPNVSADQPILKGIDVGAINDANVIVGEMEWLPVVWDGVDISQRNEGLPPIEGPGGGLASSQPTGINAAGVIVGIEYDWLPDYSNTYSVAVRWKPDPTTHAPGATVKALPGLGGIDSAATAVNVNDWVVGWATLGNKRQHAVLWERNNRPRDLGTLGGKQSSANGINAEGDIAGEAQTVWGAWHAVLWTHLDFKATDLNGEISESMAKQITLTSAVDTNDRCMVLANGVDNKTGAQESFVLSLSPTDTAKCNEQ
jgi:probable HAF family extracellular repeat protein